MSDSEHQLEHLGKQRLINHWHYIPLEQLLAAMDSEPALTLVNTPLDLQITICIFLHPSDILALRKVCHRSTLNLLLVA